MKSNQRSPLWPYLMVLTGLFILSLAVPRGWHEDAGPSPSETQRLLARQREVSRERRAAPQVVVVRPAEPQSSELVMTVPAEVISTPSIRPSEWSAIGRDVTASIYPHAAWAESVAAKIADLRVFDIIKDAIPTGDVTSGPNADAEDPNTANSAIDANPLSEFIAKDLTPNQYPARPTVE